MSSDPRARIREFVRGKIPGTTVPDGANIFELGFVNSLFAMELVMFVEREFEARVPNDELRLPNFCSVDAMAELVDRLDPPVRQGAVAS